MRPATTTTATGPYEPPVSTIAALICCPCFPMARGAVLLGRSYVYTWVLIASLYMGGIACYAVTYILDEPELSLVPFTLGTTGQCVVTALIGWCLNMAGAPLAITFLVLQAFGRMMFGMYSSTGLLLTSLYAASVVLVYDLARHLR